MLTIPSFMIELSQHSIGAGVYSARKLTTDLFLADLELYLLAFLCSKLRVLSCQSCLCSLSSVDAYHVRRRCWPRLLVVRSDGGSCPVRSLRTDLLLSHIIGGRVCLILPFWIILMGRHGVICSRYSSFLCLVVSLRFGAYGLSYSPVLAS